MFIAYLFYFSYPHTFFCLVLILHVKIRAVIKYNFAHSEPPLQTLPWKKDLIWGFGTKRNLLFWEEKKFWFSNNKINFLKEYSPARVKVVNENTSQSPEVLFILNSYFLGLHCLALPPNISADRKSFLGDQFVFPSPPSALSYTTQIYSTSSRKFKDISKNAQINISLKLL